MAEQNQTKGDLEVQPVVGPEEQEEKYDVFIAHSSTDLDISLELMDKLEKEPYSMTCFHSERDFLPGGTIVNNALHGITQSRKVILLISETFLKSDWFIFETQQTLQKGYGKKMQVMIPILYEIDPSLVPASVKEFNYLTWDEADFWPKLIKAIGENIPLSSAIPAGNVAHGLAWSYFYGFLNLVLPGLPERVRKSEWATEEQYKDSPILPKLLVILPKSCYCPGQFLDLDKDSFSPAGWIPFNATRAGNIHRDYKSSVYKVKCPDTGKEYYFLGEFATPLLSLYEMEEEKISGLDKEQKLHQRMLFHDKLKEIMEHPNNSRCHNRIIMITYDDEHQTNDHVLAKQIVGAIQHDLEKEAKVTQLKDGMKDLKLE